MLERKYEIEGKGVSVGGRRWAACRGSFFISSLYSHTLIYSISVF